VVHEVAAQGFNDPLDYEAARPSYPPDAVAWFVAQLGIGPGRTVADLAAGTGKLTRLLRGTGATLLAVEPVAGMREAFRSLLPDVPLVACTTERLALRPDALDAVTVAQAWHWFDHDRAIAELRRTLRIGGRAGLVWNARERHEPWVDAVWDVVDRVEKHAPWRDHDNWKDSAFRAMPGFGPLVTAEFHHRQPVTPADVLRRISSVSHVAVLPAVQQQAVLDEVRAILDGHPDTAGRTDLAIPYRVDCLCFERIA
jgi:ubiquinone/menaquinone biosynthesis C-methylase UbiE